ncbi:hypothetical protein DSUL_20033 [Desulfovibrionales bacterium]
MSPDRLPNITTLLTAEAIAPERNPTVLARIERNNCRSKIVLKCNTTLQNVAHIQAGCKPAH